MNIKIEGMMEEYNSIVKKIRRIRNEHRYDEAQFEMAEMSMNKCLNSIEQLLSRIDDERKELVKQEKRIFAEFRQEYPNVSDEDIYSSMEYEDAKQSIVEDRNLCDKFENQIQEYISKYSDEIEKIRQDEAEFKEKQEALKSQIKEKILNSQNEYGCELGIIRSIVKVNNKVVENIFDAGTKAEFELSKELRIPYNFYENNSLYSSTQKGLIFEGGNSFKLAEKCTLLREKDAIAKREKRMSELRKLLEEDLETFEKDGVIIVKGLEISITQKELIQRNLLPEKFGWKSLQQETDEVQVTQNSDKESQKNNNDDVRKPSFSMIEYKPKKMSRFKNFLKRIFG